MATWQESGSDIVVTAVDSHPRYLAFVDDWVRFWNLVGKRSGLTPVILAVDVDTSQWKRAARTAAVEIRSPSGISSAQTAQIARILWPGSLDDDERFVVTSDIDMLPLSTKVIDLAREQGVDGSFVVARNLHPENLQYPVCYSVARVGTWKSVFGAETDVAEAVSRSAASHEYEDNGNHGGVGWTSDQEILFSEVCDWEASGGSVVRFTDAETGHRGLDRAQHFHTVAALAPLVTVDRWNDYHAFLDPFRRRLMSMWLYGWLQVARLNRRATREAPASSRLRKQRVSA